MIEFHYGESRTVDLATEVSVRQLETCEQNVTKKIKLNRIDQ